MSYLNRSFIFPPHRLIEKRQELEKTMQRREELIIRKTASWSLEKLLKQIAALASDEEIERYARKLQRRKIFLLSEAYFELDRPIKPKVLKVLIAANSGDVFRVFWRHFLGRPRERQVHDGLRFLFQSEDNAYLQRFTMDAIAVYRRAFLSEDPFAFLTQIFVKVSKPILEVMEAWRLKLDTPIRRLLIDEVWSTAEASTFLKESSHTIIHEFAQMGSAVFYQVLNRYLSVIPYENYHTEIIRKFYVEWGEPDRNKIGWNEITEPNIEKVMMWLKLHDLEEVLGDDNERFRFWKAYLAEAEKTVLFKPIKTVILYYKQLVVVVFGDKGNATYFYTRDVFEENFGVRVANRSIHTQSQLKNQTINLERLVYIGAWDSKGRTIMQRYAHLRR